MLDIMDAGNNNVKKQDVAIQLNQKGKGIIYL